MNTLVDYYKSKNQNLPTIKDRSKTYEKLGLGAGYQGTRDQNIALLNKLKLQVAPAAPKPVVTPTAPIPTPKPVVPAPAAPIVPAAPTTYTGLMDKYRSDLGLGALIDTIKAGPGNVPTLSDTYKAELGTGGVSQKQAELDTLNKSLGTVNQSLADSERDIRNRINQSGGIVTDSQVQRLVASEKQPLIDYYKTLLDSKTNLEGAIGTATTQAEKTANMKYNDANAPYTQALSRYDALSKILGDISDPATKDLQNAQTKETATQATEKDLAIKGYNYISDPKKPKNYSEDQLVRLNNKVYAKPKQDLKAVTDLAKQYPDAGISTSDTLASAQAKLANSAIYKKKIATKTTTSKKTPTTKNYGATNIPANIKNDLITDINGGHKKENIYKAYPEVSTTYIDSLMKSNRKR